LRSHQDKNIARIAGEIVSKWRKNVDAAKDAKKRKLEQQQQQQTNTPTPKDSPAPPSSAYNTPYQGDPEKRHFKVDNVDISRTGNKVRDGCIGVLYNGLAYRRTESIEEILQKAMEVEAAAFEVYKGDTPEYRSKIRGLMTSLKRKDNAELGDRVMKGEITPHQFVKMTEKELASEAQRLRDAQLERENMLKAQVPMAQKSISDSLQCSKCKQKKVSYSQAQTRSADEPMTTFCECTVCGHRWKVSDSAFIPISKAQLTSWLVLVNSLPRRVSPLLSTPPSYLFSIMSFIYAQCGNGVGNGWLDFIILGGEVGVWLCIMLGGPNMGLLQPQNVGESSR